MASKAMEYRTFGKGETLNEIWKGTDEYSPSEMWDNCCENLLKLTNNISTNYDQVLLIAHDTLFVLIGEYSKAKNITSCWITHSLESLFEAPNQEERILNEKRGFQSLIANGDKIGYISHLTKKHLFEHYKIKNEYDVVEFYSGIYFESKRYEASDYDIDLQLFNLGIPLDKKYIFSWGRCSDQKGFDIILNAYKELISKNFEETKDYHLILIAPTETTYKDYMDKIKVIRSGIDSTRYTFIEEFHIKLHHDLLKHKNTDIIILASRYESFGLTSIEAYMLRNSGSIIIYSAIPTFQEVFKDISKSKCLNPVDSSNLAELLNRTILNISDELSEVDNNYLIRYDFVKNQAIGIRQLLKTV